MFCLIKCVKDILITSVNIFKGVIISWRKPYYKVNFTDNDKEDFKLAEVLPLIDLEYFYDKEEGEEDLVVCSLHYLVCSLHYLVCKTIKV